MQAGTALRAAGLKSTAPSLMTGDRVLFGAGKGDLENVWEIRLSPRSWRVTGAPRQLTFGTVTEEPATVSVSATGTVALETDKYSTDFYRIPTSPASGQPTGVARRLTQDGRFKYTYGIGGDFGGVHFILGEGSGLGFVYNVYALDLGSTEGVCINKRFS